MEYEYDPDKAARTFDPQTSKDAAQRMTAAPKHARRIVQALKEYGNLTAKQIADVSGLRLDQVYRRRKELERGGWIDVMHTDVIDGCAVWSLVFNDLKD